MLHSAAAGLCPHFSPGSFPALLAPLETEDALSPPKQHFCYLTSLQAELKHRDHTSPTNFRQFLSFSCPTQQTLPLEQTTHFIARKETKRAHDFSPQLFSVEALCSPFELGSVSIKGDAKAALLLLAATLTNFCHLFHLSLEHSCERNKN